MEKSFEDKLMDKQALSPRLHFSGNPVGDRTNKTVALERHATALHSPSALQGWMDMNSMHLSQHFIFVKLDCICLLDINPYINYIQYSTS